MDERDKSRDCSVDVSVAIRIRPLNSREKAVGETGYAWGHNSSMIWTNTAAVAGSMAQMNDQRCASFSTGTSAGISAASTTYTFDHIFGQASITADVYNILASDLVESCMKGINGTIFAYGQTSSGKTHTMMGDESEPGIILLAVENIFRHISKNQDSEFLLRVSYLEIYNEVIRDLLEPGNINLKIHETINRDIFVGNLSEHVVSSAVQIKEILAIGEGNRHIGETNMNDKSSRSHTIFKMVVESRFRKDNADAVKVSQLNLVDLAGSERVGHTGAEGIRLKEGGHINKSLLTLSTVIGKLSDGGDKRHIPYRDSKLTRILQPSIGGNANTAIICTITPAQLHSDETHSTLRFASRAKTITNKPQVNELVSDETLLKRYKREIDQLKKQLVQLRTVESGQSSTENSMSQSPLPDASDLCIKPSISKKAVLEESLTGSKHGIQEKLLLNEKLDSLRHAILDSTCIGLEDISDRSLKKKARSNRRQTWFPGVSENASALTESEKIETQTWYQNLPEKAEIKIHCSRESNVMECTTVNADTQTHDCSLQLAVEKILDGQQLPSDDHYIQILQPLVACIQSYNLKVSFLTTKETQLQKVVEQLQNKLLQDETVVQQACENYGKQKSINKQLKLDLEDSKEQLTRTTKALEDSESACQSALDMCNIQKQASQCLHNEICDLKMSNSELKAQQEKTNTVLFGISTELQETIEQVHLLQLQEKKYLSTIEQQNNQLRHYCEKEKDQSSLIEQLQVQLQDFLQEKRDFESKTIEALQHSIMEKEAAEALASNFESKLFETISEMDTINIQNMDYIQRIVSEKDTTEMRVSDLEDKLAHTMQEKDELIDQNLKNAENSKLLKESAVAHALELETQLKQAFFDRDTAEMRVSDLEDKLAHTMQEKDELIDQNLKNAENSKLLKESAVARALELETQLKQAFFDRDTAEMRVSDLEDKLAHTMQEKDELIDQNLKNAENSKLLKESANTAEMRVSDLEDKLAHTMQDELIDQNLKNAENSKLLKESAVARALELETQLKQAFFDRDTAEMRVSDLEDKLAHTMQEKDELIDQNLKNAENSKLLKESAVAHALELETQLKQAFFDRDTAEMRVSDLEDKLAHTMQEKDELIDQNLKNAENSKLLKESAVARALELETQLKQAFFDRDTAEMRVSDLEDKLAHTMQEKDELIDQNLKNAENSKLLKESAVAHALELETQLKQAFFDRDTAEMRVSDLEDKLAHTMQEKDELIDQNLKNAENSKLLKESAVARALELETQLKQAFFDREVLLAQNATEIQHFEKEKNLANTRVRDLESQLTQISSVVQQLQNEKNAIEERLLDSEMEFKHILEEKSLLIIQSTANVQRFEAEKVAADDLVHELKGQLIQVMDEKETLINQGLDDVQRAISEKEIVECHMMDLETKLAQTLKEMETAATQSAIDIQHLEADKNSAEVCTLELQNQLIAMSHFIEIQLNHVYTWINQFEHNFYLQLQEKESYLRAKEVNIYKFMEQLCLLIDDAYTKFKRNCELEQSLEFAKKASTEIQKNITALQKRYEGNNVSKNCHVDWHEEIGQKHRLVNENFERLKRDHQPLCSDTLFILEQEKSTMSELFQLHQTMDTLFQEKFKFMDMNGILEKRLDDKLSHCQSISTELDALHYELQSTNSVYEKNRKDLEERIASLEIDLIERDQQICNLDRQYTQKCRDTETLRVLLEDERAEKENEISLFEQDAKQSTCDQTRLQNRANDLTNEIAALRDQIKEGSTKTDAFWSQKVHDLESKLAAAHIEYEQLQSSLQSLSIIMDAAKDVLKNRGFISFEDFESIYSSQTSTGYNVAFEFKKASRKVSELEQTLVERDKQIEDLKIRLRRSLESIDQETMIDRKLEHSVLPNNVSEIEPAALSAFSYLQNNRPIKSGQQSEEENTELILSLTKVAMLEQEVHMLKKKLQTMGMCLADEKGQKRQLELEIMRLENQIQLQKSKPVIQAAHIVADLENFDSLPMNTKSQQPVNQKLSVLSETVCNVNSKVDAHCQPEQNTTGTSTLSHKRTHGLTSDVTQGTRRPRLMNKADASQPVGRQREIGASGRQTRIKDKVLKEGQPGECNQQ
ncbi:hypothetical protein BDV3_004562 [Batrachochytrium dendrobatidis]